MTESSSKRRSDNLLQELTAVYSRFDRIGFDLACRSIRAIYARFMAHDGNTHEAFASMLETAMRDKIALVRTELADLLTKRTEAEPKTDEADTDGADTKTDTDSANPENTARKALEDINSRWNSLSFLDLLKEIGSICDTFILSGGKMIVFISLVKTIFPDSSDKTMLEESLLHYVHPKDRPAVSPDASNEGVQRGRKPLPQNIRTLAEGAVPVVGRRTALQKKEVLAIYANLETQWNKVPLSEKAKLIRAVFNFESRSSIEGKPPALDQVVAKLKFLDRDSIIGYIQIAFMNPDNEADDERIFTPHVVRKIGSMYNEFQDIFHHKTLYDKLLEALKNQDNITKSGTLKIAALDPITKGYSDTVNHRNSFMPGKKYRINTQIEEAADTYKGIADEEFEFVPETDPLYAEWKNKLDPSKGKLLFKGNRGYFFLDPKFVTEAK